MNELQAVLEALIFASDVPLATEKIVEICKDQGVQKADIVSALDSIRKEFEDRRGGFLLEEVAGGYQFRTRPDLASWVKRLKGSRPALLSPAGLETLAVIAYRQPVVKAEIDAIRGVDVGGVLKSLLDRKLVRMGLAARTCPDGPSCTARPGSSWKPSN